MALYREETRRLIWGLLTSIQQMTFAQSIDRTRQIEWFIGGQDDDGTERSEEKTRVEFLGSGLGVFSILLGRELVLRWSKVSRVHAT